jgi:type IV secretory pathway VirB10-like protein
MSELSELTNAELRELLESKGLDTSGKKSELIERLEAAETPVEAPVEEEAPVVEEAAEEAPEEAPEPVAEPKPKAKKSSGSLPSVDGEESNEEFVRSAYLAILKREADAGGLGHYVRCLELHQTMDRQAVLDDLLDSAEAKAL